MPELESFIADESASALNNTIMPTEREISGLFSDAKSILEIPRSVTLLSPEILDQLNIKGLRDLERLVQVPKPSTIMGCLDLQL